MAVTNGVFVNGSRVRKEAGLTLGDELAIGDVRFRLQTEAMSKSSKATMEDPRPARPSAPQPLATSPLSMDVPVALSEIGADFAVEPSIAQMRPMKSRKRPEFEPQDDVVPLASDSF